MWKQAEKPTIFEQFGVTPVINACGVYTDLGGSILSPRVWAAMSEVNRSFVSMVDLLDQSGRIIADLLGAEAARVTPGVCAGLALGAAACMTGMDGAQWERLPDTAGIKHELILQRGHRYRFDRCARVAGARLVEVGDDHGTTLEHLASAIGPQTAAIFFPAHLDGKPGTVPLREITVLACQRGIPTLVDSAYLNDPPEVMRSFTAAGADLVCFSAKYFGGPNAGGFVCGRKDLIEAVAGLDFTNFASGPHRPFGRPFKLDRQIVVGVVVALQEWLTMNHQERWDSYSRRAHAVLHRLQGIHGATLTPLSFTMDERLVSEPVNCVAIRFDVQSGKTARHVSDALAQGHPSIATLVLDDVLVVAMDTVRDGEELLIADRLKEILGR